MKSYLNFQLAICSQEKQGNFDETNYIGLSGMNAEVLSAFRVEKRRMLFAERSEELSIFIKAFEVKGLVISSKL